MLGDFEEVIFIVLKSTF